MTKANGAEVLDGPNPCSLFMKNSWDFGLHILLIFSSSSFQTHFIINLFVLQHIKESSFHTASLLSNKKMVISELWAVLSDAPLFLFDANIRNIKPGSERTHGEKTSEPARYKVSCQMGIDTYVGFSRPFKSFLCIFVFRLFVCPSFISSRCVRRFLAQKNSKEKMSLFFWLHHKQ